MDNYYLEFVSFKQVMAIYAATTIIMILTKINNYLKAIGIYKNVKQGNALSCNYYIATFVWWLCLWSCLPVSSPQLLESAKLALPLTKYRCVCLNSVFSMNQRLHYRHGWCFPGCYYRLHPVHSGQAPAAGPHLSTCVESQQQPHSWALGTLAHCLNQLHTKRFITVIFIPFYISLGIIHCIQISNLEWTWLLYGVAGNLKSSNNNWVFFFVSTWEQAFRWSYNHKLNTWIVDVHA